MHATWLKNRLLTRSLGNKTPYEMLFSKKPNLSNLPVWGCRVKVHTMAGSKLNMRAHNGHWVGFDCDSNGHHVYFEDTGHVGIERSIHFGMVDILVPIGTPFTGEKDTVEAMPSGDECANRDNNTNNVPVKSQPTQPALPKDHLGHQFKSTPPPRRSTRIQVESAYVKHLKEGEGTHDGRNATSMLPRGVQMSTNIEAGNLAAKLGMVGGVWRG
ncbi:hypothetical protein BDN67DRAFT_911729 [Paxillus ammoniavirescens]|nr:hypothetical protein BDN67DRAFT_911729 [Paxillus ammoniavirescens]